MADDRRNRLQGELQAIVDRGLPRAFIYAEDADGAIECYTAGVADLSTVGGHTALLRQPRGPTSNAWQKNVIIAVAISGASMCQPSCGEVCYPCLRRVLGWARQVGGTRQSLP